MRLKFTLALMLFCFGNCASDKHENTVIKENYTAIVFKQGDDGYQCFRIPAIINSKNGTLIAFAEARKNGCSDTGDIDLVMKQSSNEGKTWGALKVIWNDSLNVCGNPSPVLDTKSGKLFLLTTWNLGEDHESEIIAQTSVDTRRVFVLSSSDHGDSWSSPSEITSSVKDTSWTWYATGPGSGMQVSKGPYANRMIVACDHIEAKSKRYYSHVIYSDDSGDTWNLGGTTPQDQVNECEVAEASDGSLILNMRNYDSTQKNRQTALSIDGGLTWTDQQHDETLIEPICQASLQNIRYQGKHALVFSNPASQKSRANMTIRLSKDDGKSWVKEYTITKSPAAYSDLIQLENETIGCLYETGEQSPYETIVYTSLTL